MWLAPQKFLAPLRLAAARMEQRPLATRMEGASGRVSERKLRGVRDRKEFELRTVSHQAREALRGKPYVLACRNNEQRSSAIGPKHGSYPG